MSASPKYKQAVINRLSRFALEPDSMPVPLTVRNDVKVLLNALGELEQKAAELTKRIDESFPFPEALP